MSPWLIALIVPGAIIGWIVLSYNRFVAERQLIDNSWANVESELRRRHDLIPNLVETVRGYATHEQGTFTAVIDARNGAASAAGGPGEHEGVENLLVSGLRQLFAVSEAYPELQASVRFLDLHRELVTTEDRLQAARRLFNGNVREFNRRVESIPSMVIARAGGFERRDYFEVESVVALVPNVRGIS